MLPQSGFLKGRKTYVVAMLGLITAIATWSIGDLATADMVQAVFAAIGAMTIRAGIKKAEPGRVGAVAFAALLVVGLVACAQAPATTTQPLTGQQRTGQGDNQVAASAGSAQAGVGDRPNRQGLQGVEDQDVSIQTPALDRDGSVIVGNDGKPIMTTVKGRGLRDLYIGSEINNDASAQISGETRETAQSQASTPTATQTPTADVETTTDTTVDIPLIP